MISDEDVPWFPPAESGVVAQVWTKSVRLPKSVLFSIAGKVPQAKPWTGPLTDIYSRHTLEVWRSQIYKEEKKKTT